jgi:hypothetical protein
MIQMQNLKWLITAAPAVFSASRFSAVQPSLRIGRRYYRRIGERGHSHVAVLRRVTSVRPSSFNKKAGSSHDGTAIKFDTNALSS